jgi:peptidoglycan hydrolase-like protein with peptidoglycan-binding domain
MWLNDCEFIFIIGTGLDVQPSELCTRSQKARLFRGMLLAESSVKRNAAPFIYSEIHRRRESMNGKFVVVSSVVFSGALALYASTGWSQQSGGSKSGSGAAVDSPSQSGTAPSKGDTPSSTAPRSGSTQGDMDSSAKPGRSAGMRSGSSSQDIRQVQEALKTQGHDPGPIDGVMGPKTRHALRAFQQAKNLKATGQLDSETTSALGVSASSSGMSGSSGMGSSSSGTSGSSAGSGASSSKPRSDSDQGVRPDSKSGSGASTGADKTGKSGSDR